MWDTKKVTREIKLHNPLIYFDNGKWFCAYRPSDKHGLVYSLGIIDYNDAVEWARLRVAEWSEQLSKEV